MRALCGCHSHSLATLKRVAMGVAAPPPTRLAPNRQFFNMAKGFGLGFAATKPLGRGGLACGELRHRGQARKFPKSVCTSVNECVCHGIPDDRPLEEGDITNIDVTVYLDGFHGDTSRMFFVGEVDPAARKLEEVTKECLDEAIKKCGPGVPYNAVGKAIQSHGRHKPSGRRRVAAVGAGSSEEDGRGPLAPVASARGARANASRDTAVVL
ncbi:Methionine aminopeptidase 1D, chloroplastic/mitochondrial [Tetrabaena socialis]|uniref:Methionine aminopeptidase 1D, chloroplastic/mitochondrial n=1 Tax=Tetrabaena socialis TaxID=47790 RepID=A0A2J7ZP64_9CHLO|nr:Methionine aminopeptidase 1D, chloroplastic/mitochondrial [Tetrabaena socialis]|eukprot:PNH02059.1 Methionine aminopeptidase 1D, chloroplastic/mitochondrial [Tetrabaena socialis]